MLQGATWLLSEAAHAAPPSRGATLMTRFLRFRPPPHVQEQPLQCDQAAHRQSRTGQGFIVQSFISFSEATQLVPPFSAAWSMERDLVVRPSPQGCEQLAHSLQVESSQRDASSQESALQPLTSLRSAWLSGTQFLSPDMCRTRVCCPPPQATGHVLQSLHSEKVHQL